MCVNGWESEYPFSVNSNESEYPKIDESGNIYESGKISSSVNLVLLKTYRTETNIIPNTNRHDNRLVIPQFGRVKRYVFVSL